MDEQQMSAWRGRLAFLLIGFAVATPAIFLLVAVWASRQIDIAFLGAGVAVLILVALLWIVNAAVPRRLTALAGLVELILGGSSLAIPIAHSTAGTPAPLALPPLALLGLSLAGIIIIIASLIRPSGDGDVSTAP